MKDKSKRKAYHIRFNFTMQGGKKSSDDIDCWISGEMPLCRVMNPALSQAELRRDLRRARQGTSP